MKIIKFIILLLLLSSCFEKKAEKPQTEFDKILGKENSETMNVLVAEFENDFLKRQYPNLDIEDSYLKFVSEVSEGKTEHFVQFSEKSKKLFRKSRLRLEVYCIVDSTWVEKNPWNNKTLLVKGRTKCLKPDGTFESGSMEMPFNESEVSRDSILKRYMNFVKSNFNGTYLKALNSISDKSDFLKSFVEIRNNFGIINSKLIAKRMLAYNVNMNDYYIRRIIVIELSC